VEFFVLGPLAVRDAAGTEVSLPRNKQRMLVAALLLSHGRVVPRERLIELLWDEPPPTAGTALHGHVSQLRKLLGRDRVETRAPGYLLRADDDEIDVRRFEAAVTDARTVPAPAERAERLRTALALWRGPPYAELEEQPFVHAERERLRELQLLALEEALAAELDDGRAADAVPELELLAAEHPFRERVHGLLMLALYRAGRQADALAAYRALRLAYTDELGIEPGTELQQLERQILNHDERLDGAAPRTALALPGGTVTFLFTDVESSTDLLHELGAESYAALLTEHHRSLRATVTEHGGVEVDTPGDGSFAAFVRATDALASAEAMHRDAPMRIRIGIHTGEPVVTAERYVGQDVHLAARIAASAHGGQTVLSDATRSLLHDVPLRDLGEHRFKGFAQRERVWQVGEEHFPPLRAGAPPNLPAAIPTLFGRDRELAEIDRRLRAGAKLVTLIGPGGAGKTQLSLHAARALDEVFVDGICFVDLAPLGDVPLVTPAIAQALGVGQHALDDALLRGNRLLVLDNAEHLPGIGGVVAPWLSGESAFLVTSRAPLHIRFEQQLAVEPLSDSAAGALFVERAAAVGRTLEADATVLALCRHLDNLPLAVELAAARTKHLDPAEILARESLAVGPTDAPDRHRTLHATIDWSYQLLTPDEQRVFSALGVFNGGWTLEAAEEIAGASVDLLAALVDESLVRRQPSRFDMLETIREFALERTDAAVEERHAEYFASFAERMSAGLAGSDQRQALRRLDLDLANLRAALEWSREHEPETMRRIALALPRFWQSRGMLSEARHWFEAVVAATDGDAEALYRAGNFARLEGDHAAALALHARGLAEAEGSAQHRYLVSLGQVEAQLGDLAAAQVHLERASSILDGVTPRERALTVVSLGAVELELGNYERAAALTAEGVAGLRAVGDEISAAFVLPALAYLQAKTGDDGAGRATARDALELAVSLESWMSATWALLAAAYVEADTAPESAARWLGAVEAEYARNDWPWEASELRVHDDALAELRARLDGATIDSTRAEGAADGLKRALNDARRLVGGDLVSTLSK
jgi:DNA-binding SARP family transcriptional activator/predicted ATPase